MRCVDNEHYKHLPHTHHYRRYRRLDHCRTSLHPFIHPTITSRTDNHHHHTNHHAHLAHAQVAVVDRIDAELEPLRTALAAATDKPSRKAARQALNQAHSATMARLQVSYR